MSEQNQILTAKEVLEAYPNKFSLTTLWRLEKRQELKPCGRIGKKTRVWRKKTIDDYLTRDEEIDTTF